MQDARKRPRREGFPDISIGRALMSRMAGSLLDFRATCTVTGGDRLQNVTTHPFARDARRHKHCAHAHVAKHGGA